MSTRWQRSSRVVHPDDNRRINQLTSGDPSAIVQADKASRTVWLPKGSDLFHRALSGLRDALSRVSWTNPRNRQSGNHNRPAQLRFIPEPRWSFLRIALCRGKPKAGDDQCRAGQNND
jgi:hypothetical protein